MRRGIIALALCGLACGEEPPAEEVVAVPEVATPLVEMAGCEEVENERCMLAAARRQLTVWIDVHAAAELDVRVDDAPVEFTRDAVDGGLRIGIEVPVGSAGVVVAGVDPRWSSPWTLAVGEFDEPGAVTRARKLAGEGKGDEAITLLESLRKTAGDRDRVFVLGLLRRVLHGRGDEVRALQVATEEADLAHRVGLPRAEAFALAAAAFLAGDEARDAEAARRFLSRLRAVSDSLPEARMMAAYYNSLVANNVGDVMLATSGLTEAERVAARLRRPEMAGIAMLLAAVLRDLGRGPEARAAVRRSIDFAAELTCGDQARQLNTAGFTQLLLAEHGLEHEPAEPLLESALERVEADGPCPSPRVHADVRVNLALAALEDAEPEQALDHLAAIEELPGYLEPWVAEINARAGLETGRWELLPPLVMRPDPAAPLGLRWAALERQARLLEQLGLLDAAIAAHVEAEALLEEGTNGIAVDIGRDLFLAGRSASSRELVRMLVDAGQTEEAFCRARLARGRALRRLDRVARLSRAPPNVRDAWSDAAIAFAATRDRLAIEGASDWELSEPERERLRARRDQQRHAATRALADAFESMGSRPDAPQCSELPPPKRGEQVLLPFPLDDGWILFVADETEVAAFTIPEPDADTTGLLERIAPALDAPRLRILPTGRSWAVPFHAVTRGDNVLVYDTVVTYGLDLSASTESARVRRAVIVSDPSENLPMAHAEADAVEKRLRSAGWTLAARTGPAATRSGIAEALAGAALLHYAGHGVHRGETGWDAALLLPEGDALTVPDILALPAVPKYVVLTGCETGRVSADTPGGGMNIGRAFAFAGAEEVLVVEEKVDDALARRVGEALYHDDAALDLAAALRRVQVQLRDEGERGWEAFRVITR